MKITLFILVLGLGLTAKSQTMNHYLPWNVQTNYLKTLNLPTGTATDSIIVKSAATGWFARVSSLNYAYNAATVGLSKAQLNASYPNVPIGYRVLCPAITLGGAIYVKATENGSNDVWQLVSAPPVM